MVDPVSANAATRPGRLGPQLSGGREPVDGRPVRPDLAIADRPPRTLASNGAPVVSEGREAARRMAAEPPVDSARVSELRAAIESGRYRVDPDRIADAMLRSEPGLLRS